MAKTEPKTNIYFFLKQTNKYKHKKQFKILLVCNGEQTSTEWFQVLLKLLYETSIAIIDSLFDLNSISDYKSSIFLFIF